MHFLVHDPNYIAPILSKSALENQLQWCKYIINVTTKTLLNPNTKQTEAEILNQILLEQQTRAMKIQKKLDSGDYIKV